ncbi:MAG: Uncharacterized protein G01um101425_442 [Candidatus Peregrinibacteria bacterium Gr01-1014_25]|nr:MAG: Uncharacterized protein G01um101425_442 [Candidatus Peregrinibacteria bacterium Gr01-1014_25]
MPATGNILRDLVMLGERQLLAETRATDRICAFLKDAGIPYDVQTFPIQIPQARSAVLTVDGDAVDCVATCFTSGVIPDKETIISSAMPMAESPDLPNINVNPYCPVISRANHYRKPAVAVSHAVLTRVLAGKTVRGEVAVELVAYEAHNIVVGNIDAPATVVFTHYDSIGPGAFDNASGTAAVLEALVRSPALREDSLVVLSGAEELSTDLPYYWGAGYRRFQERHPDVLARAQSIVVVDSVGRGAIGAITDARTVRRAFPLADMETLLPKIRLIAGSLEGLMPVYHSALDTMDVIDEASIAAATDLLLRSCGK